MKLAHESIFASSLRAFCTAFFAVVGITIALLLITLGLYELYTVAEKMTFPSSVKIMPDADGNRKELTSTTPVLLEIYIKGKIGEEDLTATKIEEILLKSREKELKDGRVKGILLVINSPGGGVNDSDIIYHLLRHYKAQFKVPIYAYVDGLCASGGYYIACAADKIYATDVSLVGSVGVVAWPPFFNLYDAIQKIGVNALTLSAGKGKDELNPLRPWKENEQEPYQHLINFFYDRFLEIVTTQRTAIDRDKLVGDYGAKVFPAPQAKTFGYIDRSGANRSEVLRDLAAASGIAPEHKYQVISFETKGWVKKLLSERSPVFSRKVTHEIDWTSSLTPGGTPQLHYIWNRSH